VHGTSDRRSFTVRGHAFYLCRSDRPVFGFEGGGRDGDLVAADAPQTAILGALIAGIPGARAVWGPEYAADTPAALDAVERALLAAAGRYDSVLRRSSRSRAVAEELLRLPRAPGAQRALYLRGEHELDVRLDADADDAVATESARGRDPGAWLETTLRALGVEPERLGGGETDARFRVPRSTLQPLLSLALERFGWADVRLTDLWS
jgi:hypothetical protein